MRSAHLFASFSLIASSFLIAANSKSSESIAVLDFKANNTSAGDAAVVSEFIRSAFVLSREYIVVEKANIDRILMEQAFQQTGCTEASCAVRLGKLLNVKKIVVGSYSMMGGVRFINASLVDVETAEIQQTAKVKDFEASSVDKAAEDLVNLLTKRIARLDNDDKDRASEDHTEALSHPGPPKGPESGLVNKRLIFARTQPAISNERCFIEYRFDWGDKKYSKWSTKKTASHSWAISGDYRIKIQARCRFDRANISISDERVISIEERHQ